MFASTAALVAEDIHKRFGDPRSAEGISLRADPEDVISIHRRLGLGQEHVPALHQLPGDPDSGRIVVGGEEIRIRKNGRGQPVIGDQAHAQPDPRESSGWCSRASILWTHMTVAPERHEGPLTVAAPSPRAEVEDRAMALLAKVGIKESTGPPGGAFGRAAACGYAIARALCMEPQVLLFDEPTSALDPELVGEVLKVMRDSRIRGPAPWWYVTHEMGLRAGGLDRVMFLADGRVEEENTPPSSSAIPGPSGAAAFSPAFF
jgi:ABC-type histidine transport system ATPase subunit